MVGADDDEKIASRWRMSSPTFLKPWCEYGGRMIRSPAWSVSCLPSTQNSAVPSSTMMISSRPSGCMCVGAPMPFSFHDSLTISFDVPPTDAAACRMPRLPRRQLASGLSALRTIMRSLLEVDGKIRLQLPHLRRCLTGAARMTQLLEVRLGFREEARSPLERLPFVDVKHLAVAVDASVREHAVPTRRI